MTRSGSCIGISGALKETYHYGYPELDREIWRTAAKHFFKYGASINLGDAQLLFHNQWSAGYYHWLIESMPRLLALRAHWGKLPLLLPARLPNEWFRGWLEEISEGNFQELKRGVTYSSGVFCQRNPRLITDFAPRDLRAISEYFYGYFDIAPMPQSGKKIYITRRAATHRRIFNEPEIISSLENVGFTVVELENMSFPDQVSLFSQASVVVSVHGAGLSNIVFMRPGMKVIELLQKPDPQLTYGTRRKTHLLNPCFKAIASSMGLEHLFVLGDFNPASTSSEVLKKYGSLHGDIRVKIDDITSLL
ncbi:DUF563 domain-containing protein [Oceaniovalibus sp. ACAM 378]|uniref:glycosyltransferase family 61 protein n=1 Tax=Oceaniovalibus sp. ACAM 378 TaxID=2599923 RepID=UPI0011DC47D0|nr:glycosyltransferase family 61 protein [Oceaniovalibus sp. ACAM 378]TYB85236.1 glycosyltransferase family 61 protein [Oceaniovalibus sp. ACAM 378]